MFILNESFETDRSLHKSFYIRYIPPGLNMVNEVVHIYFFSPREDANSSLKRNDLIIEFLSKPKHKETLDAADNIRPSRFGSIVLFAECQLPNSNGIKIGGSDGAHFEYTL